MTAADGYMTLQTPPLVSCAVCGRNLTPREQSWHLGRLQWITVEPCYCRIDARGIQVTQTAAAPGIGWDANGGPVE